jgi:tetratricopeptide (TPR) repeat protein
MVEEWEIDRKRALELRNRLSETVDFDGFIDPKMTLQDALDILADRYDLSFHVLEFAFRTAGYGDKSVLYEPIAAQPIPKMRGVSLATVLRRILSRIATPPGQEATYIIRRDQIEIMTVPFAVAAQPKPLNRSPKPLNVDEWEFNWQSCALPAVPEKRIRLQQKATGELLKQFEQFEFVQASEDGRRLLTGRGREVRLWDIATGLPLSRPWVVHRVPVKASFTPDERAVMIYRLAPAPNAQGIVFQLWDSSTGKRIGPEYERISFSHDGQTVATSGQVWDRTPLQGEVRLLVLWTQVLTQLELDENDTVRRLDETAWKERLSDLAALTENLPANRLASAAEDRVAWLERQAAEAEKTQKWAAAVDLLGQLIPKQPNKERSVTRRGLALAKSQQWQKVVDEYSRLLELNGDDWEGWYCRALAHTELRQIKQALSDCSRAAELAPEEGAMWLLRSVVHAQLGRMKEAEADYAKAAQLWRTAILDGVTPAANKGLDALKVNLESWQLLADLLTRIIEQGKPEWWHWRGRGLAHSATSMLADLLVPPGDVENQFPSLAYNDFSEAIRLQPSDPEAWAGRGALHLSADQWALARDALIKALELRKDDASLWLLSARAHQELGQLEKAIADLTNAINLKVPGSKAWLERGENYGKLRQWEKAIADYSIAGELDPKNAWTMNNRAWILATCPDAKLRDPKLAVALAKSAVDLTPTAGTFWNTLGAAHYRSGDCKAAIDSLKKSIELRNGGDSFDWFFLAMTHGQLGDKDRGRKWYDQAVQWMQKNKAQDEELLRFGEEAAKVLGIDAGAEVALIPGHKHLRGREPADRPSPERGQGLCPTRRPARRRFGRPRSRLRRRNRLKQCVPADRRRRCPSRATAEARGGRVVPARSALRPDRADAPERRRDDSKPPTSAHS